MSQAHLESDEWKAFSSLFTRVVITSKTLYLFPDTNVFLQCKSLEQVDWSSFGTWGSIQIVITRPVQSEIDAFKGKGNSRQASRARTTSSLIRRLLDAEDCSIELRLEPRVLLCLRHDLRRDESVANELDYVERDDQLVGTALAFQKSRPEEHVKLLTNDTGPMASAKAVGLPYRVVPQDWLLQPEANESEKLEKQLRAEIAKYKNAEPDFQIECLPERLSTTVTTYSDLTEDQIQGLLLQLRARYPLETDFGPTEPQERSVNSNAMSGLALPNFYSTAKEVFLPATAEEIEQYEDSYVAWTHECEAMLGELSDVLNARLSWPELTVRIRNTGSRPAEDALVTFELNGKFWMTPLRHDVDADSSASPKLEPKLPHPPTPPKGRWKRVERYGLSPLAQAIRGSTTWLRDDLLHTPIFRSPVPHDPNAFYFKVGEVGMPSKATSFTCDPWRHARTSEDFKMSICSSVMAGTHTGCLQVSVHAANLTEPEILNVPLQLITKVLSCLEFAEQMLKVLEHESIQCGSSFS
ncbi:PIN domain-containing protein [Aquabacterium sp.]|uniref:PIN domain-containing protein n=1 Tax=Aquabacterium sp. TaxID=1872578 RepID=UPI004037C2AA